MSYDMGLATREPVFKAYDQVQKRPCYLTTGASQRIETFYS